MKDIKLIQNAFLGKALSKKYAVIYITNIKRIYLELKKTKKGNETTGHFEFTDMGDSGVLRVPPGIIVVDALRALAGFADLIHFVGYGGALCENIKIGELIEPSRFVKGSRLNVTTSEDLGIVNSQVDSMLKRESYYKKLRELGVSTIDMESFEIVRYCKKHEMNFKISILISDKPLEMPFFSSKTPSIDLGEIHKVTENYV